MRTCESTGPRPQIRRDDYDTKMPLHVNDTDLMGASPPTEDKPYWTDMTIFRIRAEGVDLRRTMWFDMVQIDTKRSEVDAEVKRA